MRIYARSERGRTRTVNQDRFAAQEIDSAKGLYLLAVADGMGGHLAGEVASDIAIKTLTERIEQHHGDASFKRSHAELLKDAFSHANRAIVDSSKNDGHKGMGTTLTAALVYGNRVCIGHVGDSRAYLKTQNSLLPLTSDHSVVGEMVRKGDLSDEQAMRHPQRNYLTRALGAKNTIKVDTAEFDLDGVRALVLCSDGITGLLNAEEISAAVGESADAQSAVDAIVGLALKRGGFDDATCVIIRFCDESGGGAKI